MHGRVYHTVARRGAREPRERNFSSFSSGITHGGHVAASPRVLGALVCVRDARDPRLLLLLLLFFSTTNAFPGVNTVKRARTAATLRSVCKDVTQDPYFAAFFLIAVVFMVILNCGRKLPFNITSEERNCDAFSRYDLHVILRWFEVAFLNQR